MPEGTLLRSLAERAPGIIALQELTPEHAEVIAASDELRQSFPYQVLEPTDSWDGMGLLSSWPISGRVVTDRKPPLIAATVDLPDGMRLDVIVAHAPPPQLGLRAAGTAI